MLTDECLFFIVRFTFFSTKPNIIGWKERLQGDLFCVERDVKPYLLTQRAFDNVPRRDGVGGSWTTVSGGLARRMRLVAGISGTTDRSARSRRRANILPATVEPPWAEVDFSSAANLQLRTGQ